MSQEFFDPELFADFIAEAKEHLETIEPNLLELEKTPDNLALLNDIFRPMHSLKGASGFLGLNRINQLAHKSENILDELRKGSMVVTSEIMDVILASTDALRQMIDNLEVTNAEGDVEIEHIMAQIEAIMAGDSTPQPEPAAPPMGDAPLAAEALEPVAKAEASAQSAGSPAEDNDSPGLSTKEWVAALPCRESYALTAFGEGHLKDFIDESYEIIASLNDGLLELEENPTGRDDLVNDLFRFFHNMKGNSGIIGYNELNALTHEAETLLNNVRQGKITPSHELIDLLLLVADVMEGLVQKIEVASGQATPFDTSPVIKQLQQVLAGGAISLPEELLAAQNGTPGMADNGSDTQDEVPEKEAAPVEVVNPTIIPVGSEGDDAEVFRVTVRQQIEIIRAALATLQKDGSHKESIDAVYRCLVAVRNACSFVGQTEIKVYAERTAGIVDQGRISGIDFGLMVDLLSQEVSIIDDMVQKALDEGKIGPDVGSSAQAPETSSAPEVSSKTPEARATSAATAPPKPEAAKQQSAPSPAGEVKTEPTPKTSARPNPSAPSAPAPAAQTAPAPASAAAKPKPMTSAAKAASAAAPAGEAHKSSSTIRVDHERLDHLMNLIGELIINRNRYTLIARSLEGGGENVNISEVAQSLSETTYAMARISDDLQDTIMKVRMVPVSSVFSRFPRWSATFRAKAARKSI